MHPLLKYLLPLAVVLPLGGYVVGSLTGVADDHPPARTPIELRDDMATPPQPPRRPDPPTDRSTAPPDGEDREDDDDVPVITPRPVSNDDRGDWDRRDDRGAGDGRDDGDGDENEGDGDD